MTNFGNCGPIWAVIMTPTVLVLGAGASQPYGYPLGQGLVDIIVGHCQQSTEFTTPASLGNLLSSGFSEQHIKDFAKALSQSGRFSVDAFLESRGDFLEVGRTAIVNELLEFEKPNDIFPRKDWYQNLYNAMCDPDRFESFGESKVSIITFNYDRSLEYFLFTALRNGFQKNLIECVQNFEKIPIIHVHGRLGPSPTQEDLFPYGTRVPPDKLKLFAKQIKIIHEATDDLTEFKKAQTFLSQAQRICFLGFGFHRMNMERLFKGIALYGGVEVFCSRFHVTDRQKISYQKLLPPVSLGHLNWGQSDQSCLQFLDASGALLN